MRAVGRATPNGLWAGITLEDVDDAAAALVGADRIRSLNTLVVTGSGSAPNAGQNRMPDDELPVWKVTEHTRTIDLANNRTRVEQLREAQFQFAGATVDGAPSTVYPPLLQDPIRG